MAKGVCRAKARHTKAPAKMAGWVAANIFSKGRDLSEVQTAGLAPSWKKQQNPLWPNIAN
jgi:hypothetical protein